MKAKITRPDGTVVEAEGEIDEILKLLPPVGAAELVFGDFFWPAPERQPGCPGIIRHPGIDVARFRFLPCEHEFPEPGDSTVPPHCRKCGIQSVPGYTITVSEAKR